MFALASAIIRSACRPLAFRCIQTWRLPLYGSPRPHRSGHTGASDYTNFVGNVLGFRGQSLLSYNQSGYSYAQNAWSYQELKGFPSKCNVIMWSIGPQQAGGWTWVPTASRRELGLGYTIATMARHRWGGWTRQAAVDPGLPLPHQE